MSKRITKLTLEERIEIVQKVIEEKKSISTTARKYEMHESTVIEWVRKYISDGIDGLKESRNWKQYPE